MEPHIIINVKGFRTTSVKCNPTDSVFNLLEKIGATDGKAIYNGKVLMPSLSFAFYGIENNCTVYVVYIPKYEPQFQKHDSQHQPFKYKLSAYEIERLRKLISQKFNVCEDDLDFYIQKYTIQLNPNTRNEVARLTDMYRTKTDNNIILFRKIYGIYQSLLEKIDDCKETITFETVLPEKASLPSTQMFPAFF